MGEGNCRHRRVSERSSSRACNSVGWRPSDPGLGQRSDISHTSSPSPFDMGPPNLRTSISLKGNSRRLLCLCGAVVASPYTVTHFLDVEHCWSTPYLKRLRQKLPLNAASKASLCMAAATTLSSSGPGHYIAPLRRCLCSMAARLFFSLLYLHSRASDRALRRRRRESRETRSQPMFLPLSGWIPFSSAPRNVCVCVLAFHPRNSRVLDGGSCGGRRPWLRPYISRASLSW